MKLIFFEHSSSVFRFLKHFLLYSSNEAATEHLQYLWAVFLFSCCCCCLHYHICPLRLSVAHLYGRLVWQVLLQRPPELVICFINMFQKLCVPRVLAQALADFRTVISVMGVICQKQKHHVYVIHFWTKYTFFT